ncbi:MAG: O-antigen ligase family protein [Acidimicrobiia bacterium]
MTLSALGRRVVPGNTGPILTAAAVAGLGAAAAVLVDPVVALAGVVGALGAAALLFDPALGLGAMAVFAVMRLPDVATDFHGAPSLFTPLVAIIALALAIHALSTGRRPAGGWRAAAAAGSMIAVALASLLFAEDPAGGLKELEALAKDGAVAVLAGMLLFRAHQLRTVTWILVGGGFTLSVLSVLQFATGSFDLVYGGFAQSAVQNIAGSTDDVRISGPIGDPNFYAQWLVMLVPLAIDRFGDENRGPLRVLAAAAAVLCSVAVVLTFSRGGLIALIAVLGLMALRHPPRLRTLAGLIAVGVLALPLVPNGYVDRVSALTDIGGVDAATDPSIRNRGAQFNAAWEMFSSRPLSGVGYGNYIERYNEYARDLGVDLTRKPREAHNLFMETAAETGVPGLIVLGTVFTAAFAALRAGRRRFRAMGDHRADGIGYALAVALIGYLVTSIFLHMAFARLVWLLLGLALAFPSTARAEDRARTEVLLEAPG